MRAVAVLFAIFPVCLFAFSQADKSDGQAIREGRLRVLSAHRMSEDEIKKHPSDFFGVKTVVVFRYESPEDRAVYIYAPPNSSPLGYSIRRIGNRVVWRGTSTEKPESPGFEKLKKELGDGWIFLSPGSAMEWSDKIPGAPDGSEHALSVFLRDNSHSLPREVISDWFRIPE